MNLSDIKTFFQSTDFYDEFLIFRTFRNDTHITSMKIDQFSRHLSIYVQNSSTPLTLDVQFQMNSPLPKDNQSIKRKHNQLINLVWPSFDFLSFQLAEASLSGFFYGNNRNGIIKRWLHCLDFRFKRKISCQWCLVMTQIKFSLIRKERLDVQTTC